jgi:citrate synthase
MYDPAYMQTASCKSEITYLDGDAGILRYRRLPDRAARRALDVPRGRVPAPPRRAADQSELDQWRHDVTHHTFIHENMRKRFVDGFHYDAHPMGMFVSAIAALGTFYDGRQGHPRRGLAPQADPAPDRQDADDRRDVYRFSVRACRSTIPTTPCRTRRTSST